MTQILPYLVPEDWCFVSPRLAMARSAKKAGHAMHVATRVGNCARQINRIGRDIVALYPRLLSATPDLASRSLKGLAS